tara:strand:- start:402 stop:974 length:573 start_codon:yes stop_codon:yes gene_type:complete
MNKVFFDGEQRHNNFADGDFQNHPGWLSDVFTPQKAESERYQEELVAMKGRCYFEAGYGCSDLQSAKDCLNAEELSQVGDERVASRKRKAAKSLKSNVDSFMSARECVGGSSSIDTAQDNADTTHSANLDLLSDIKDVKTEAADLVAGVLSDTEQQMLDFQMKAEKDKKMMMYVGGGAIAILVLILVLKR